MVAKRYPDNTAMNPASDGVMELSLLISHTQFDALETGCANRAQMTVAQYLRRLVQRSLVPANANVSPDQTNS